jgi:hypothetical protein
MTNKNIPIRKNASNILFEYMEVLKADTAYETTNDSYLKRYGLYLKDKNPNVPLVELVLEKGFSAKNDKGVSNKDEDLIYLDFQDQDEFETLLVNLMAFYLRNESAHNQSVLMNRIFKEAKLLKD